MKRYKPIAVVLIGSMLVLMGCATTKITSFCDPDYQGTTIEGAMVAGLFGDLETRQKTEGAFIKVFNERGIGIRVIPSMKLAPPTRPDITEEEMRSALKQEGISMILAVQLTDAYSQESYVPESSYTEVQGSVWGNTFQGTSSTQKFGGFYVSKPTMLFKVQLYDTENYRMVWTSSSLTRGDAFADFDAMVKSLAHATLIKLYEDGLIKGVRNMKVEDTTPDWFGH